MWAVAVVEMGIPLHDFFRLTPLQFHKFVCALENRDRKMFWGHAQTSALIANVHRDPKKKSDYFVANDFMPTKAKKTTEDYVKPPESIDDMMAFIADLNRALGGKDLRAQEQTN